MFSTLVMYITHAAFDCGKNPWCGLWWSCFHKKWIRIFESSRVWFKFKQMKNSKILSPWKLSIRFKNSAHFKRSWQIHTKRQTNIFITKCRGWDEMKRNGISKHTIYYRHGCRPHNCIPLEISHAYDEYDPFHPFIYLKCTAIVAVVDDKVMGWSATRKE